jgi:putative PIG3 family NAD(P)H quinone oxidoreductase
MSAIDIPEPGGPEILRLHQIAVPAPVSGEVLLKVEAAAVNRPDVAQRQGIYPPPPGAPETPGLDVAGMIVAQGCETSSFGLGDRVCALVAGGGYAEYCIAPTATCLPIPQGFSAIEAAAIPETFFTVWSNLFDRAKLVPGERLLVHGGTSGIGTTAIALATSFGASVITTAGSDEKCEKCLSLGADHAINYRQQDFVEVVRNVAPDGVNVVLDIVGGDYMSRTMKCLAPDGRHISIAFLSGAQVTLNLAPLMMKRLTLTGSTLRARDVGFKGAIANVLHDKVWPLFERGEIKPLIDSTYALGEAAEAHRHMESSTHMGKIVLIP